MLDIRRLIRNTTNVVMLAVALVAFPSYTAGSVIDDRRAVESLGVALQGLEICHQHEWRHLTVRLDFVADAVDSLEVRGWVKRFLTEYSNPDDFWEVMNTKLVRSLTDAFPDMAAIKSSLSLAPDQTLNFPRESVVSYDRASDSLKESFHFTKLNFHSFNLDVSWDLQEEPEYPDYQWVDESIESFFKESPLNLSQWSGLKPKLQAFLLERFPSMASVTLGVESISQPFDSQIPVISLKDFSHPERREEFVQKLGHAFEDHGFVAIVDVDIDPAVLQSAHRQIKEFFSQDIEAKKELQSSTNNGERGYVTGETPRRQPIHIVDFKEIFHIGREGSEPPNLWPKDPAFKDAMIPLYGELERVMQPVAEAASEYLGERPALFAEMMQDGHHLLRALHYLRDPGQTNHWAAEHTDMNFLTFIPGGASKGLQVQLKDGKWIDVLVPENAVVVNVGDSLENLSNGVYRSGVHRVVASSNSEPERWSIVFHGHTRHDLEMGPLKGAIALSGGVQKYPDAKGWELLYAEIAAVGRATRPMLEELAKSGVVERQIDYNQASEKVMKILAAENLASEKILAELS